MKTKLLTTFLFLSFIGYSQTGSNTPWNWLKGFNYVNEVNHYGTPNVPDPSNTPGGNYDMVTWVIGDTVWVWIGDNGNGIYARDFWKYHIPSNTWILVQQGGSGTPASYGVKGVASVTNRPGGRSRAHGFVSQSGELYLFGGTGADANGALGQLNDMWKYSPLTKMWTWLHGSNLVNPVGVYNTKGTSSANGTPGGRELYMAGKTGTNSFWVYGGSGYATTSTKGQLDDLWSYDASTNQWTWIAGSSTINTAPVYGTKTVANIANTPGARADGVGWTDNNNNIWIFSGWKDEATTGSHFNDLWKYDPASGAWAWMTGDQGFDQMGSYGVKGTFAASNKPGARAAANGWKDMNGDLWLLGGWAWFPGGRMPGNDLWKYSRAANQWVWMKGDTLGMQIGVYAAYGSNPNNKPGPRGGHGTWADAAGNFYFAGGYGLAANSVVGYLSDVWKISSTDLNTIPTAVRGVLFENEFTIGPNPVRDILHLKGVPGKNYRVTVTGMNGQLLINKNFSGLSYIPCKELPPGSYHIEVVDLKSLKKLSRIVVR